MTRATIENMFDMSAPDPDAAALSPAALSDTVSRLVVRLSAASGLDDAGRVDAIRALERLTCVATAAQAALAAELDASQRAAQAAAGVPAARQGRGVAAQVALARRESPHRGQQHLALATVVQRELPSTWRAWRTGHITEWKATVVARETACLSLEDRLTVDASLAGDPATIEAMGVGELTGVVRAAAAELDAAAVAARRRRAERERRVSIRPAPDTMTYVTALLPVREGVAVHAALTRAADSARSAGDERSSGQVMADTLVDAVVGRRDAGSGGGVTVDLVVSDQVLFGDSDRAAHVDGYGPVPAELAREWVAGACTRGEELWLRRLYTSPTTGELVAMDSRARLFPAGLARFVRLRDRTCRTPWCDAPVRHTDHVVDHRAGGPTDAANAQGLCEACNHAKQAPGWRASPGPAHDGHEVTTTTPTGHHHRSRAPAVARVLRSPVAVELSLDFVLAG